MLTSKQRAYLRGLGNSIEPIFHIGKGGISPEFVKSVADALEARELVKINVLDNNLLDTREAAETVAQRSRADVVQVIGNRFILYKKSKENPKIELPKK